MDHAEFSVLELCVGPANLKHELEQYCDEFQRNFLSGWIDTLNKVDIVTFKQVVNMSAADIDCIGSLGLRQFLRTVQRGEVRRTPAVPAETRVGRIPESSKERAVLSAVRKPSPEPVYRVRKYSPEPAHRISAPRPSPESGYCPPTRGGGYFRRGPRNFNARTFRPRVQGYPPRHSYQFSDATFAHNHIYPQVLGMNDAQHRHEDGEIEQ